LLAAGHDVVWCGDWVEDPGDDEVMATAHRDARILVTLDKDFGELAIVRRQAHSGIVRLVGFPAREQAPACERVLARYGSELEGGAIATVSPGQVRLRPAVGAP
jgi:predicted nuclease of predicted toxin-antitoxin system